ncbi:MAG TPA: LysE family translocator [Afifellaceae bacterium]|nr:LysE family translocator [Afifellaceae bacterium]
MDLEILLALVVFAFVMSITPGPNNLMVLTSGVNFGFRRTIPHMLGISAGLLTLLLAVGFGLGMLVETTPWLHAALKAAGGAYLLYLAWRIAFSRALGESRAAARPLSFGGAALFQWVNPKAWVMALAAMAGYTRADNHTWSILVVGMVIAVGGLPCVSVWAGFGTALRAWLSDPIRLRWFNGFMGVLLALSLWPMLLGQ